MGIREGGGVTGEPSPEGVNLDTVGENCRPEVPDREVGEVTGTEDGFKCLLRTSLGPTIGPDLVLLLDKD